MKFKKYFIKNIQPYIIAEIGVNHNCNMKTAFKQINLAKKSGANAVKFQTYKANLIASKFSPAYWDINEENWKFATIPNRSINIKPSDDDLVENEIIQQENLSEISTSRDNNDFWKNISGVLAAIWIFTVLVWFYSKPVKMRKKMKPEISPQKKQEKLLRHAKNLALSGDIENFKQIIIEWAKFQWPDRKPLSLEQIASRVGDPLKSELRNLDYLTYGPNKSKDWNGQLTAKALKNISLSDRGKLHETQNSLPPLMPN